VFSFFVFLGQSRRVCYKRRGCRLCWRWYNTWL